MRLEDALKKKMKTIHGEFQGSQPDHGGILPSALVLHRIWVRGGLVLWDSELEVKLGRSLVPKCKLIC